jgi:hypothetical protein
LSNSNDFNDLFNRLAKETNMLKCQKGGGDNKDSSGNKTVEANKQIKISYISGRTFKIIEPKDPIKDKIIEQLENCEIVLSENETTYIINKENNNRSDTVFDFIFVEFDDNIDSELRHHLLYKIVELKMAETVLSIYDREKGFTQKSYIDNSTDQRGGLFDKKNKDQATEKIKTQFYNINNKTIHAITRGEHQNISIGMCRNSDIEGLNNLTKVLASNKRIFYIDDLYSPYTADKDKGDKGDKNKNLSNLLIHMLVPRDDIKYNKLDHLKKTEDDKEEILIPLAKTLSKK